MVQLAYGTVVSVVYLTIQVAAAPFRKRSDEFFAAACSFLLVMLFVVSGIYKYGALLQLQEIQVKMSPEQQTDYLIPYVHLSSILLATSIGALVALGLILAVLAMHDVVQRDKDRRAALARRLRYTRNDEDVKPAALPSWPVWLLQRSECPATQPGPHHLFLSHNWAQGQVLPQHQETPQPYYGTHCPWPW